MYIVKNKKEPISYTYWIIHHINDKKIYYHGVKTERHGGADIRDLEVYHGSSNVVSALYLVDSMNFEKRIEKIFNSREEAGRHEERVHYKLDVAHNDTFYNLRNGCYERSIPAGLVSAKIGSKNVSLKKEAFDILKAAGIAVGVMHATVTCIDLQTGKQCRIPQEEFDNNSRYVGASKGQSVFYNEETGVTKNFMLVDKPQYPWVKYGLAFKQYRRKEDLTCTTPVMLHYNDSTVLSGEFIPYCSDMITVYDKDNDKHFNLHASDPRIGTVYPTSASVKLNKDNVKVYDKNFNTHTMKSSLLTNDFINVISLNLKLKSGGKVSIMDYNPETHNVAKREILIIDNSSGVIFKSSNADERLCDFKRYRRFSEKSFINFCYIEKDSLVFSIKYIEGMNLFAERNNANNWLMMSDKKIIGGIQNVIKKFKS